MLLLIDVLDNSVGYFLLVWFICCVDYFFYLLVMVTLVLLCGLFYGLSLWLLFMRFCLIVWYLVFNVVFVVLLGLDWWFLRLWFCY